MEMAAFIVSAGRFCLTSMDKNQMDTLLKTAEQKLKQEPTAEISNDGQNNLDYRLGMVAWGDSKSLSAYSICF
jgi:hypothetical protein